MLFAHPNNRRPALHSLRHQKVRHSEGGRGNWPLGGEVAGPAQSVTRTMTSRSHASVGPKAGPSGGVVILSLDGVAAGLRPAFAKP